MALVDILSLPLVDFLRSGALIFVLLIVMVKNDREIWITVDTCASVGFGLAWALFPSYLLNFEVVGQLDETAITLTRLFGLAMIGTAVVWYLTRETLDGTVPITLMTARVFSCAVIALAQIYTQFGTTKGKKNITWSEQHMYFGFLGNMLWLLGNFYFLLRSHDFSTYPQFHIKINEFLRVDAMFSLLLSLTFLAFPDLILKHFFPDVKVATCVDLHMLRCTGALLLNLAIISLQAPGFLHERDKRAHFTGRLVAHMLLFLPFIFGAVFKSQFTLRQVEWALLVTLPLIINGVLGYLAGGTIIYNFKFRPSKKLE